MAGRNRACQTPRQASYGAYPERDSPAACTDAWAEMAHGKPALRLRAAVARMPDVESEGRGFRLPADPRPRRQGRKRSCDDAAGARRRTVASTPGAGEGHARARCG